MIRKSINNYVFISGMIISLFLQITFIPHVFSQGIVPNLVLISLIAGAFLARDGSIFYVALFAGYSLDLYSGKYFGAAISSFIITVFFAMYINHYFLKEAFSLDVLLSAAFSVILYYVSYYSITYGLNSNKPLIDAGSLAMSAVSDILILAVIFYPLIYIFSYNRNEK